MASETAIAAVVSMGLTYCRKHERHEVEAAIELWKSFFGGPEINASDLKTAVTSWAENLDEDAIRAQTLPLPSTIQRIMGAGREVLDDELRPRADQPARPEVVNANRTAYRQITHLAGGLTTSLDDALRAERKAQHRNHRQPTFDDEGQILTYGNEECPACNGPELDQREGAETRAKIREILAGLPEPLDQPVHSCDRCRDGSGMIDTAATRQALLDIDFQERAVYPCPKCNADLFRRWQKDRTLSSAATGEGDEDAA